MIVPPFLKPGDTARVIATSGALKEPDSLEKGLAIWRERGYRVIVDDICYRRSGYLAGSDAERRLALKEAWLDRECRVLLCARGGYGSTRLLEEWNWPGSDSPKWLIGFSDVTAILWSLAGRGIASVHGPVLTTLGSEPPGSIDRLFDLVEGRPLEPLQGKGWGGGTVTGRLFPANLTVATHILGTGVQPNLEGAILALEDTMEAPYRIDRMLTTWRALGILKKLAGIAIGRFSLCDVPGSHTQKSAEVIAERLEGLNIPIVSDLPFGHDGENRALPVGLPVRLDGDGGRLEILPFHRPIFDNILEKG